MPNSKIVYRQKFLYRIMGFFPADNSLGAYGFSVELDKDLANKALQTELTEQGYKHLTQMAETVIRRAGLAMQKERVSTPYHFVGNKSGNLTCLLQFCTVPGNACDLGIDGIETGRLVERGKIEHNPEYDPHNVDHPRQAYSLLSLWLNWADLIEAFLSK